MNFVNSLKRLISFMIIMMVYICVYSLLHKGRGSGNFFGDEDDLSLYINTIFPFFYFSMLYSKNKIAIVFYMSAMI